jgi:hypothetical protein
MSAGPSRPARTGNARAMTVIRANAVAGSRLRWTRWDVAGGKLTAAITSRKGQQHRYAVRRPVNQVRPHFGDAA